MDFTPVAGDTAGNNLKWDSMKIEAGMYLKTGNYSLLRDVRMRQARFTELEGNERIAISYYCMAFYADLNGFENLDRLIAARDSSFSNWKCTAHVDVGVVNKIFYLCSRCSVSESELLNTFCRSAFKSHTYQYHIFTIKECQELLLLAKNGHIGEINNRIQHATARFLADNSPDNKNIAV